jgi:hypothetical protein
MDETPQPLFNPDSTPYGPPSTSPQPPAASAAPAPYLPPPLPPREVRPPWKNRFGVASVWVSAFALLFSVAGRFNPTFVMFAALGLTFGIIALVKVREGRPRIAAIVGTALAALAILIAVVGFVTRL